jgi:hypothetical protein
MTSATEPGEVDAAGFATILPLVLATAVSSHLGPDSIYAAELSRCGIACHMTLEGRRFRERGMEGCR